MKLGSPRSVFSLAFDPSGALLAIGTSSGVQIWPTETGRELLTLPGQWVYAIAFNANGTVLAWGDDAGVVHLAAVPE